jgi:RimJ/RimL family protein N-acetyltransferase
MPRYTCRRAVFTDYPEIFILQKQFFDSRGTEIQRRPSNVTWIVCVDERSGRVIGCYSYEDLHEMQQRYFHDFYRAPGFAGLRAIKEMHKHLEREAYLDALDVIVCAEPFNLPWIQKLRASEYEIVGVIFSKRFKPA